MAYGIQVDLDALGLVNIRGALIFIPRRFYRGILHPALRAGAEEILKSVRSGAPRESGLLKQSLGIVEVFGHKSLFGKPDVAFRIQPRKGFRRAVTRNRRGRARVASPEQAAALGPRARFRDPRSYAHLVELGHQIVTRGTRKKRGFVQGTHFMRRGFNSARERAEIAVRNKLREVVESNWDRASMERLAKKAG